MQDAQFSKFEVEMHSGGLGEARKRAMTLLFRHAKIVGAKSFVPIASAHIDGCLYHGQSSLDFVEGRQA